MTFTQSRIAKITNRFKEQLNETSTTKEGGEKKLEFFENNLNRYEPSFRKNLICKNGFLYISIRDWRKFNDCKHLTRYYMHKLIKKSKIPTIKQQVGGVLYCVNGKGILDFLESKDNCKINNEIHLKKNAWVTKTQATRHFGYKASWGHQVAKRKGFKCNHEGKVQLSDYYDYINKRLNTATAKKQ